MACIEVKHLNKSFGKQKIIQDLSFNIEENSRVAIVGESGVGKTTLLRMIAGLESFDSGEIIYQKENKTIGMIFQDGGLFEHALVKDNIIFGLKKLGYSKEKINKDLLDISKKLHIEYLLNRYPVSLSGGEKQRVGIARALIRKVDILLLDEPFSNLDIKLTYELEKELLEIQESYGMTMIMVTHNMDEAFFLLKNRHIKRWSIIRILFDRKLTKVSYSFRNNDVLISKY